ncbi:radical SAM protein [Candidatus Woesearchaeota archaeon]|nr:radical SAM protein [Candidatus Woesearchaeota archaeon]
MKTYGPVPSWRLGNSLGVDLVEAPAGHTKTCSFDCIYCQLGHKVFRIQSPKKIDIKEENFKELKKKIKQTKPDYITFSGEGEPTSNLNLGYAAKRIKEITDVPIAVLTNSSFVHLPQVRKGLNACDLVIAKIDAPNQDLFEKINRPYHGAPLTSIVQDLKKINTKLAIQTLLFSYDGLTNADDAAINGLMDIYEELNKSKPITIYLGTAHRPTDAESLEAISETQLEAIAKDISSQLGIEVRYYQKKEPKIISRKITDEVLREEILGLLKRRPCTLNDISSRFSNMNVSGVLQSLINSDLLEIRTNSKRRFYLSKEG